MTKTRKEQQQERLADLQRILLEVELETAREENAEQDDEVRKLYRAAKDAEEAVAIIKKSCEEYFAANSVDPDGL